MRRLHIAERSDGPLGAVAPGLEELLLFRTRTSPLFRDTEIERRTVSMRTRDGLSLATDLYLPPRRPASAVSIRTPYGRASSALVEALMAFARRGLAVVAQDCRGTGGSEPDRWDYYVYELEDGPDLVAWVTHQPWSDGRIFGCGGSYAGQTQWCMSTHPAMTAIAPEMSGVGIATNTVHLHMYLNAYSRSVGRGEAKSPIPRGELERRMLDETLRTGYFDAPFSLLLPDALVRAHPDVAAMRRAEAQRFLWTRYARLSSAGRAEFIRTARGVREVTMSDIESLDAIFGPSVPHDAHSIPYPERVDLFRALHAPALMVTGWYDWALNDALATWAELVRSSSDRVRRDSRLIIGPSAHNAPGYHEGADDHVELAKPLRTAHITDLLMRWYASGGDGRLADWPRVAYYLMGANAWCAASEWPPAASFVRSLYLAPSGALSKEPPEIAQPDGYAYDPEGPTPTLGGSIVSSVYTPGSVDISPLHERPDVLTYTTPVLERPLDVVGPLRLVLYASSSAVDTDFAARLSDLHSDGRAILIQSGMLRARYRDVHSPQPLEPGRVYRFEIDMWATACRFEAGHRLRIDISSADFPRFDRNAGRGGGAGSPVKARQLVFHDRQRPSHVEISVLGDRELP